MDHPNIMKLHYVLENNDFIYLFGEHIEKSLIDYLTF